MQTLVSWCRFLILGHHERADQGDEANRRHCHPHDAWPGPKVGLALVLVYQPTDDPQSARTEDDASDRQPTIRRPHAASRSRALYVPQWTGTNGQTPMRA